MNKFQQEIYKTIDILTDAKLKQLGFDKTKRGKVISINDETCIVAIDGAEYTCKLRKGIHVQPNDVVFVKFPQNNDVDKYVDATLGNNEIPEYLVISAEEILTKLKTVDGEGSGLDADMLDGKHGSEFATKEDIEGISIDGDTIVQNINTSTSIIDDKNLSANVNDSISKKHDHSNKSILDTITQALIDGWNNAVAHISDKIKHITSSERALWNTVSNKSDKGHTHMESDITNLDKYTKAETDTKLGTKADKTYVDNELANKVDKITGKGLSTEDYTTAEKTKLSNIEDGAEKNKVDSVNSKTGDVVINKADIGLSNVENKSSATIRNEITKTNVTNALGYTPENSSNKGVANGYAPLDSNIKIPLSMLPDIAKQQTYVVETIADRDNLTGLIMGEKCYITTLGDSYIWDGIKWVTLAKADWENVNLQWTNIVGKPQSNVADIDDATSKRHTHSNKSIIDTITQTLVDRWNSAWNHISDAIRHITSAERTKWNTVDNKADTTYVDTELNKKVDKVTGKQLSTEDFTTTEKNKLANIEDGANKYTLPNATTTVLGGIKVGANLSIAEDGTLSAVDDDSKSTFIIKQELFVATEGQTLFNLTKGHYQPNTNTISVYLYGGKQPNIALNEISTSSFEINEPLKAGDVVLVEYIELSSAAPYPIHGNDHLLDGYDPIPLATVLSEGLMSKDDKFKLDGIENGANKYTHPSTHPASMITESTTKRFVSDAEKSKWNGYYRGNWDYVTFNVYGDADVYYPVVLTGLNMNEATMSFLEIYRAYSWKAPDTWNTPTHKGGLNLSIHYSLAGWGGQNYELQITLSQTYSKMVADVITASPDTSSIIVWLRGGDAQYQLRRQSKDVAVTVYDGVQNDLPFKNKEGTQYETIYNSTTTIEDWFNFIGIRKLLTTENNLYIGGGYRNPKNSVKIYHENNKPTPSDIGASPAVHTHDDRYYTESEVNTLLGGKVDNSKVLTNVPANAKFTDTITTINGKTGAISKADIVALGIPAQDTVYTHPATHPASMITESTSRRFVSDTEKTNWSNKWDYNESTIKAVKVNNASNADTVNGKTVAENVPVGAKFTDTITSINNKTGAISKADIVALGIPAQDTIYTHPSSHPASMITESATKRFVSDTEKASWNSKQDALGYTPVNKAGDTMTGDLKVNGNVVAGTEYIVGYNGTSESLQRFKFKYNGSTGYLELWRYSNNTGWTLCATFPNRNTGSGGLTIEGKQVAYKSDIPTKLSEFTKDIDFDERYYTESEIDTRLSNKVDKVTGKGLSSNDYTTTEKNKLAGIEAGANNYSHPSTHPASMITESTTKRFVSDTEKANWNKKAEISDIPTKVGQLENDKNYVTQEELGSAGYGDMVKCYNVDTDILTDRGFINITQLNKQDKVATLNPSNDEIVYQPVKNIYKYSNIDKLYEISNQQIDLSVTLNHKMYIKKRGKDYFELVEAKDIIGKRVEYKKDGIWKCDYKPYVEIEDVKIPIKIYAEFMGYYLSEGCTINAVNGRGAKDYLICITQVKPKTKEKMSKVTEQVAFLFGRNAFVNNSKNIKISDKRLYNHLHPFGKSYEKYIPDIIMNSTQEVIRIFLEAYIDGDGNRKNDCNRKTEQWSIFTTSKKMADQLQELALKAGWSANISEINKIGDISYINGRKVISKHICYRIGFNKKKNTPMVNHGHVKKQNAQSEGIVKYGGSVIGVEVAKYHTLYVRRNGKAVWSGNSTYDTNNNGIVDNAEKVNGFTVETNVPANAKFTDTIYTHPSTHPASMITGLHRVATTGIADKLNIVDTRNDNSPPSYYFSQGKNMFWEFKYRSSVGNPPAVASASGTYAFILTITGWGDSSGGYPVQISVGGQNIAIRQGISTTAWGSWYVIPNVDDIPTKLSQLTKDINFDERYYTETEIDTKLAAKSDKTHDHDTQYEPKVYIGATPPSDDTVPWIDTSI